mmetsp:Transcript_3867/g.6191  ORF Transcript_3867/g.6191 Transcript_3867/m.6191 type:complete len:107 (-) Transcript_3867:64-384(-)
MVNANSIDESPEKKKDSPHSPYAQGSAVLLSIGEAHLSDSTLPTARAGEGAFASAAIAAKIAAGSPISSTSRAVMSSAVMVVTVLGDPSGVSTVFIMILVQLLFFT